MPAATERRRAPRALAVALLATLFACDRAAPDPALGPPPAIAASALAPAPASPSALAPTSASAPALTPAPAYASALDASSPPPPRRPGAYANVDPADDDVPGPPDALPDCDEQLARAGVTFRTASLPVHKEKKLVCGAPQVVIYQRGPGRIAYDPSPLLTCTMALALASFEHIVQDEAARVYGKRVARIVQLGTYNCREMAAYPGWVSEHAYANAIDLATFVLENGVAVDVKRDFDLSDGPPAREGGDFLRAISRRAFDEDVFSHVLTPFFDAHHKDHFHLDLARYRSDGTRPER